MSDSPEQKAMATMQKAQQLINDITRQIEDGNDALRRQGLNPEKVRAFANSAMDDKNSKAVDEQLRKDLEEVENEVRHANIGAGDGAAKAKRPRSMV